MPIHDWAKVPAGNFHDFHHDWITFIKHAVNRILPPDYYAMAEQITGSVGPDVLALEKSSSEGTDSDPIGPTVLTMQPQVRFHAHTEEDRYAAKTKSIVIRHISSDEIIAMIEIVSSGNKNSRNGLRQFVNKVTGVLRLGIHMLIVDLFPPSKRDPQGIHKVIWDQFVENDFALPANQPLTQVSYVGGMVKDAWIEPMAVGETLATMPLYLSTSAYVNIPLEETYQTTWNLLPSVLRDVLTRPAS